MILPCRDGFYNTQHIIEVRTGFIDNWRNDIKSFVPIDVTRLNYYNLEAMRKAYIVQLSNGSKHLFTEGSKDYQLLADFLQSEMDAIE